MKIRKRQITEDIEQLNQEIIRMLGEKENYMYLEVDTIKLVEIKKNENRISQMNEKVSRNQSRKQKSHPRDKHQDRPLVWYSEPFLK